MNHEDCYKEMYLALTNEITNTIERLQGIQQKAEECYICANEVDIYALPKDAQIRPIEDLQDHYEEISVYCNETGKPVYLTENRELNLVIVSDKVYNESYKGESQDKEVQFSTEESLPFVEEKDESNGDGLPETAEESSNVSTPENAENLNTPFIEVGEVLDVGSLLWPESSSKDINGQFLDGGVLHMWGADKTIRYDYYSNTILQEYNTKIIPLGINHYYSCTQQKDSTWLSILYDKELQVLSEFSYHEPVILSIDGNYAVSVDKSIEVIDVKSEDTNIYKLSTMSEYQGSIYNSIFDGEKVYFSATLNPLPGNGAIGYFDVLTGELTLFDDISAQFAGLPEYAGENQVWYWQDGSAYGTDGTYCILLDSENGSIAKYDLNDPTCKLS